LSTNLLSKLSIFETGIASSLHSRSSESQTGTADAADPSAELHNSAALLHDPLDVSPLTKNRRLQRPDSLASKIIQQLNEKVQSPKKPTKLYSPRQVKQLIKAKGGSNHLKQYLSESLHTNNSASALQNPTQEEDWDDDNEFANESLSPYRDAPISLSPQEVRALIESNAKAKLFHEQFIASQMPTVHLSSNPDLSLAVPRTSQQDTQDADQPASQVQEPPSTTEPSRADQPLILKQTLEAAKSRHRKFQTELSNSTIEPKRPLPSEPPATASRVLAAATLDTEATHKSIRNQTLDITNFVPPQFPKTEDQHAFIQAKVQQLFVFSELQGPSLNKLVEAFEPVAIQAPPPPPATDTTNELVIATNTDNPSQIQEVGEQQHFYIVHEGQVEILVDGVKVAEAGKGDCFGEQALLHQPKQNNTILKAADEQGARLLRLDQQSFRGILQSHATQAMEAKRKIIRKVDFLKPLLQQDDQLLNRLVSLMIRRDFTKDEEILTDEEKSFIIVDQGILDVSNASGSLKLTLEPGDYFGERALLGTLPKKATGQVTMKAASSDGGVLYSMDRGEVELVLGQDRLQQLYDLNNLVRMITMIMMIMMMILLGLNEIHGWSLFLCLFLPLLSTLSYTSLATFSILSNRSNHHDSRRSLIQPIPRWPITFNEKNLKRGKIFYKGKHPMSRPSTLLEKEQHW
jgi:CRP-like cAMP-binding protein